MLKGLSITSMERSGIGRDARVRVRRVLADVDTQGFLPRRANGQAGLPIPQPSRVALRQFQKPRVHEDRRLGKNAAEAVAVDLRTPAGTPMELQFPQLAPGKNLHSSANHQARKQPLPAVNIRPANVDIPDAITANFLGRAGVASRIQVRPE